MKFVIPALLLCATAAAMPTLSADIRLTERNAGGSNVKRQPDIIVPVDADIPVDVNLKRQPDIIVPVDADVPVDVNLKRQPDIIVPVDADIPVNVNLRRNV
ncbi:hypothetical protein NQ176_g7842 [Zarea fungicola]|uniref:Uncharacterized protein n=1 Tax=Zarea fungicola TaxID=93591 RepID=A0ACC1MX96_9HYPO|nr:hypothetical protein NQ176_g7842 [Lecanicillium fungicola]